MLDFFYSLKNLFKIHRIVIDSTVFRLHYNATVMILIAFSVMVTTSQFVGNPIECLYGKGESDNVINTYCWIQSTYTVVTAFDVSKVTKKHIPHLGISTSQDEREWKFYKYYQWVGFTLFFQAGLFYFPRWLWKYWEGGKIEALTVGLRISLQTEIEKKQRMKIIQDYLWKNLQQHAWWAYRYFLCEILSFINVVSQLWLMDRFFDGEFVNYGLRVIEFIDTDQKERVDPMIFIFPRISKCQFRKFGDSGAIETRDAICVLPLNVVNEKIYIFLWFWFIILASLTAIMFFLRISIFFIPRIRILMLYVRFRVIPRKQLENLIPQTNVGDWFLFYMLGQNLDTLIFKETISALSDRANNHGQEIIYSREFRSTFRYSSAL